MDSANINDSTITGAARPLIFADGTQILLSPLGDKDVTELDNWVKAKYLHDARSTIPENATEEQKDRIERIAQQTATTLCWWMGHGASIMASIDGMTQVIYQSAKKNNPNITYDEIHSKLFVHENLDLANEAISKTNNLNTELKKKKVAVQVKYLKKKGSR